MLSTFLRTALRRSVHAGLLLVACAGAGSACATEAASKSGTGQVAAGAHAAPGPIRWNTFALQTIDGQPADLSVLQRGPVLLQFWASWCQSCGGLMWDLDGLAAAHQQVRYRAVSIDAERAEAARITAHPLYAQHPGRYLHDSSGALAARLDIQVVPAIVVLDAEGNERLRHVGHVNSTDLQRLRSALSTLAPTAASTNDPQETTR